MWLVPLFAVSGTQDRVQRRTVQQIVDIAPLPTLDVPAPQTVEQLVEAPTIVSLIEVIRQPVEQPVDIPVRARGGTGGRPQGVLPGQYSSSSVEQIADIPVPHHGFFGGFQGFHPGQSSAASSEQLVDIPVPHGGPHLQDPGLNASSRSCREAFQGFFFCTFPWRKKRCAELSADFTLSTPPAQQQSTSPSMDRETSVNGDDVWIRVHWQWYPPWLGH